VARPTPFRSPTDSICGNLGEAVERVVAKHRTCLNATATTPSTTVPTPAESESTATRTGRLAAQTRERHAAVHALLAQHVSLREVAVELGVSRNTVRRFTRATCAEELLVNDGSGRRTKLLDAHADYLRQRWSQGCSDAVPTPDEVPVPAQHRERVRHRQVRQPQQHGPPSSRGDSVPALTSDLVSEPSRPGPLSRAVTALTRTDVVFGNRTTGSGSPVATAP
jgi:hypothetical protein